MGYKPPKKDKLGLWKDLGLYRLLAPGRSLVDLMSLEPQVLLSLTWDDADSGVHLVERRDDRLGDWDGEWGFGLDCGGSPFCDEDEEVWPGSTSDEFLDGEAGFQGIDESLAASDATADLAVGISTDDDSDDLTEGLEQILSSDRHPRKASEDEFVDASENVALGWHHLASHLWSDTDATVSLDSKAVGAYDAFILGDFGLLFDVGLLGDDSDNEGIEAGTEYFVTVDIESSAIESTWSMKHDGQTDRGLIVDINLEAFDPHLIQKITVRVHDQHAMSIDAEQEVTTSVDDATGMRINTGYGMPTDLVYFDKVPLDDLTLSLESELSQTGPVHDQVGRQMNEIDFTGHIDLFGAA